MGDSAVALAGRYYWPLRSSRRRSRLVGRPFSVVPGSRYNLCCSASVARRNRLAGVSTYSIIAMVADPRDLLGPRPFDPVDNTRRAVVMDHYQKCEVTQADKHTVDKSTEQSAGASTLGR